MGLCLLRSHLTAWGVVLCVPAMSPTHPISCSLALSSNKILVFSLYTFFSPSPACSFCGLLLDWFLRQTRPNTRQQQTKLFDLAGFILVYFPIWGGHLSIIMDKQEETRFHSKLAHTRCWQWSWLMQSFFLITAMESTCVVSTIPYDLEPLSFLSYTVNHKVCVTSKHPTWTGRPTSKSDRWSHVTIHPFARDAYCSMRNATHRHYSYYKLILQLITFWVKQSQN